MANGQRLGRTILAYRFEIKVVAAAIRSYKVLTSASGNAGKDTPSLLMRMSSDDRS